MDSVQRQFGKMMSKGGTDDAKVSVLLQDFTNADQMLATVCSFFQLFWCIITLACIITDVRR
jgi:hypothetical protein